MSEQAKTHHQKSRVGHPAGKDPPSKTEGGAPSIVIRKCGALREFQACVELQREIWREADLELEPATTFVVASITGGQVLGAFDGETMVGFTMAVVGLRQNVPYLHSHQTGVSAKYRDRGVGRMLKLFQREDALARGIRLVEWTFDPLELKNAHFNLNRLGAICRRYIRNLYGVTTSPLHRGIATDRLVAEWQLDSPRVVAAIQDLAASPMNAPAAIALPVELAQWKREDAQQVQAVQTRIREEFTNWFARGYAAVAVRAGEKSTEYLLAPWSEF
jgi:predicted GNAT superfamily acetyltransferase